MGCTIGRGRRGRRAELNDRKHQHRICRSQLWHAWTIYRPIRSWCRIRADEYTTPWSDETRSTTTKQWGVAADSAGCCWPAGSSRTEFNRDRLPRRFNGIASQLDTWLLPARIMPTSYSRTCQLSEKQRHCRVRLRSC